LIQLIASAEYFTPGVVPFDPIANHPKTAFDPPLTMSVVRVVKELIAFDHVLLSDEY
jgi:ABC-type arginine transport system ATPase subunit